MPFRRLQVRFFGQNYGAGQIDRLYQALRVCLVFCLGWGLFLAVILALFSQPIAALFSESDEVMSVAVAYLLTVPISYGAYGLVMAVNAAFNGLGDSNA